MIDDYFDLLSQHIDAVTAAGQAFGDLQQLDSALHGYVQLEKFFIYKWPITTEVDQSAFKVRPLSPTEADALRADFLAYNGRDADARALLARVLQEDPKNVSAHETMGYLEFRGEHLEEARKWYAEAMQLDSQSYLAYYYFAVMSMRGSHEVYIPVNPNAQDTNSEGKDLQSKNLQNDDAQIESSLRAAVKLNPKFAPAFDLLAVFLATRRRSFDEAHMIGLTAVSIDPSNIGYRVNVANVLMEMGQGANAVRVLEETAKLAKTPEEIQSVNQTISSARTFVNLQNAQQRALAEAPAGGAQAGTVESSASMKAPALHHDNFVAKGPHHFLVGVLKNVHCDSAQLDLTVSSSVKSLALHSDNYFQIQFSAFNFTPSGDLNPCKDIEGRPAKVEYVEPADASAPARVLSVELHK